MDKVERTTQQAMIAIILHFLSIYTTWVVYTNKVEQPKRQNDASTI